MAGTGLQCFTVVHQAFDGECVCCARETFFFCFFAFDNRNSQYVTAEISIYVQHSQSFFLCFFCGSMCGMTFLPQKFHSTQERTCCFFPTYNGAPLVVKFRQVAVGLDDVCVVFAEQCFGSRANADTFFQFFVAAVGYPSNFGCEAFYMVFFFLQQAFGDEHGHVYVFMTCCFEAFIQLFLDQFPDCVAIGTDDHAALQRRIFCQVSFFYNVRIPLGEIQLHIGDGFYKFLFFCHWCFLLYENHSVFFGYQRDIFP